MPPRAAAGSGNRGGAPRGGRGGPRGGGRGGPRGGGATGAAAARGGQVGLPGIAASVTTIGVKRPDYGTAGVVFNATVNAYATTIPESIIYHYDAISPDNLPRTRNQEIIKILQRETAPTVFPRPVPYDGNKNIYAPYKLPLGEQDAGQFYVNTGAKGKDGQPKLTSVKVTLAQRINPDVLARFVNGETSQDIAVQTALMAMNVAIRMEVIQRYPYNIRSFFTEADKKDIRGGYELWRGYFQSVRPTIGRVLINVDISTAMMYKGGRLIDLCLDFFDKPTGSNGNPNLISEQMPDSNRIKLARFLSGACVIVETEKKPDGRTRKRAIKSLSRKNASNILFDHDGKKISVAQYFAMKFNRRLQYPNTLCVELGKAGSFYPLEVCMVPPGQIARKQVPPEKTKEMVEFSTKKPEDRLRAITNGVNILQYGQSDYIREFGMNISTAEGPLTVRMRKLDTPRLKYGPGSKQSTVIPNNGSWNMVDKKFYVPCDPIHRWMIVIYERQQRFNMDSLKGMIKDFIIGCNAVGINVTDDNPIFKYENPQGNVAQQLKAGGNACFQKTKGAPQLILVVLPENGNAIYDQVKHFGDVSMGVATQCVKSGKAYRAKPQYWANVILKVNVKLGGINCIPDPAAVSAISDPNHPTIVLGADVIHPAPGSEGRPSFAAVVGSIDSHCAKYVATNRVQTGRQEIIDDLQAMVAHILRMSKQYREVMENSKKAPTRLIFFRDGVSEGQFSHVLERELPLIKAACADVGVSPKITLIVVGKRHHIRFFPPAGDRIADRSGNCPAGSVADQGIAHPTEFDFYLQSHGGLLGTSRPSHYSVLYDENTFNSNSLQLLSFGLCHVYARSTRSVSIPAPVYYADIVCSRAKHHFDPNGDLGLSDNGTIVDNTGDTALDAFKAAFKPLHPNQQRLMYFS